MDTSKEKFLKRLEKNKNETCDWSKKSDLLLEQILSWVEDIDKIKNVYGFNEYGYLDLELTFADLKVIFTPDKETKLIKVDSSLMVSFLIFDAKKSVWIFKKSSLEFSESSFFDMLFELF